MVTELAQQQLLWHSFNNPFMCKRTFRKNLPKRKSLFPFEPDFTASKPRVFPGLVIMKRRGKMKAAKGVFTRTTLTCCNFHFGSTFGR